MGNKKELELNDLDQVTGGTSSDVPISIVSQKVFIEGMPARPDEEPPSPEGNLEKYAHPTELHPEPKLGEWL